MLSYLTTIIHTVYMKKFHWSIQTFVKSKCLSRKSMACFGGTQRRNVFTMEEIVGYEKNLHLFTLLYNGLIVYIQFYSDKVNSQTYFVLHNLMYVGFVDIYNLVIVPLKHLLLCNESIWYPSNDKAQSTNKSFM